jgi:hypothetical protein
MKKSVWIILGMIILLLLLFGSRGIDPENRIYPQVIGIDKEGETYVLMFALPNMGDVTGQDKGEEESSVLKFQGNSMEEIEKLYERSQEKYLDLGHVRGMVLGEAVSVEKEWKAMISSLREDTSLGEDIYVFTTGNLQQLMAFNGGKTDSLGDYLTGIYENRLEKKQGLTLREVYKSWYEENKLPQLPRISINQDYPEIL